MPETSLPYSSVRQPCQHAKMKKADIRPIYRYGTRIELHILLCPALCLWKCWQRSHTSRDIFMEFKYLTTGIEHRTQTAVCKYNAKKCADYNYPTVKLQDCNSSCLTNSQQFNKQTQQN